MHFARRAKFIKNKPIINEDINKKATIRQYEMELKRLRNELAEKDKMIQSNAIIVQLEDEKRRAEEDKNAAIEALEQASKSFLNEREDRKKLESKILMLNSQMLIGGHKIEDTPQFRKAIELKESIMTREFDLKLQEVEKERQLIEEDKAQVDKYKELLLKQRDIMIGLSGKLNERDEAIVQLQEEIDALDRINKELEDAIDFKDNRIKALENVLIRNGIKIPEPDVVYSFQHSMIKSQKYEKVSDYEMKTRGLCYK